MSKNYVVAIGREYGSGGRDIGAELSKMLGIKCYDKELINLVAKEKGICMETLEKEEEKRGNIFENPSSIIFHSKPSQNLPAFGAFGRSAKDKVFLAETSVIKELADRESCIIIGRCADILLKDRENVLTVFVKAPREKRIERLKERLQIPGYEAEKAMHKMDRERASYYQFYTGKKWGENDDYDLIIDSSLLGIEGTAKYIKEILKEKAWIND